MEVSTEPYKIKNVEVCDQLKWKDLKYHYVMFSWVVSGYGFGALIWIPVQTSFVNPKNIKESLPAHHNYIITQLHSYTYTVKKGYKFSRLQLGSHWPDSPLEGTNLIIPFQEDFVSDFPVGAGKIDNLFLQCSHSFGAVNTVHFAKICLEDWEMTELVLKLWQIFKVNNLLNVQYAKFNNYSIKEWTWDPVIYIG
jgi:hypothetical protein